MPTIWITYAWDDNKTGDVDFVAQEIEARGIHVKLDRWTIQAGKRLWEQIDDFIQNPRECDAWMIYATQNSLGSEPCKEEIAYALDRSLKSRGVAFPFIGLFPGSVDPGLVPAAIRSRLYLSLTDPDWLERLKAALENHTPVVMRPAVEPYALTMHQGPPTKPVCIEVRPRGGTWSPFLAAIPAAEQGRVNMAILHGPSGRPPRGGMLHLPSEGLSSDGAWWMRTAQNEATPTQSYFILCDVPPSKILFGIADRQPQYMVDLATGTPGQVVPAPAGP